LQELTLRNWSSLDLAIRRRNNKPPTLFRIECVFALSRARRARERKRERERERERKQTSRTSRVCKQRLLSGSADPPGIPGTRRLSITTFYCISISSLSQPRGNSRERPGTQVKLKRMRFKRDYARQVSARASGKTDVRNTHPRTSRERDDNFSRGSIVSRYVIARTIRT